MRFDHLNFHSRTPRRRSRYWQELGFRARSTSRPTASDEKLTGAWLRRKPTVHDVALTAGTGPRLHHFAMWLAEPSSVLRVCDQLAAGGWVEAIERGPGRHGVSNAFFVYLRDPDGHRIELYTCDYYTGDPDHPPMRWSVTDPRCRSFWGTARRTAGTRSPRWCSTSTAGSSRPAPRASTSAPRSWPERGGSPSGPSNDLEPGRRLSAVRHEAA